jgi:hypothetical protein
MRASGGTRSGLHGGRRAATRVACMAVRLLGMPSFMETGHRPLGGEYTSIVTGTPARCERYACAIEDGPSILRLQQVYIRIGSDAMVDVRTGSRASLSRTRFASPKIRPSRIRARRGSARRAVAGQQGTRVVKQGRPLAVPAA